MSNGRYSESERTDEKFNVVNWQEIVTAIEATQENPRKLSHGEFLASVMSPVGYGLESPLHAIYQPRLLRKLFRHPLNVEIDKETSDHYVQQAKESIIALGVATAQIDATVLTPLDLPPRLPCEADDIVRWDTPTDVMCLEGFKQKLKQKTEDLQQEHDKRSKADTCVCLSFSCW